MLMASDISMDERSRLRRSRDQEGVLSNGARSAPFDNTRKNATNAAGVSTQRHDKVPIPRESRTVLFYEPFPRSRYV